MNVSDIIRHTVTTDWRDILLTLAEKHGDTINTTLTQEANVYQDALSILPSPTDLMFNAFTKFNIAETRVVIIGQDVYPTKGHGMGLCFSVPNGVSMAPSLRNIFKELDAEYNTSRTSTDLTDWAEQGVLMLNTALTVLEGNAGRHLRLWKPFTTELIQYITRDPQVNNVVYMLWGEHAKEFAPLVDTTRNLILTHSHPSPLARKPFVGNNHFKLANAYLTEHNRHPVQWV